MMTREEHLEWCKRRAREYLDHNDPTNAVASMSSDMTKHPETAPVMRGGFIGLAGMLAIENGAAAVRQWIDGFH